MEDTYVRRRTRSSREGTKPKLSKKQYRLFKKLGWQSMACVIVFCACFYGTSGDSDLAKTGREYIKSNLSYNADAKAIYNNAANLVGNLSSLMVYEPTPVPDNGLLEQEGTFVPTEDTPDVINDNEGETQ